MLPEPGLPEPPESQALQAQSATLERGRQARPVRRALRGPLEPELRVPLVLLVLPEPQALELQVQQVIPGL